jgi:hypothetical protein
VSWNHRVFKRTYHEGTEHEETYLEVHECYWDGNADEGKPWGVGEACRSGPTPDGSHAIRPGAEDIAGLRWLLLKMLECLDKPVLDYETREPID